MTNIKWDVIRRLGEKEDRFIKCMANAHLVEDVRILPSDISNDQMGFFDRRPYIIYNHVGTETLISTSTDKIAHFLKYRQYKVFIHNIQLFLPEGHDNKTLWLLACKWFDRLLWRSLLFLRQPRHGDGKLIQPGLALVRINATSK
ncbi:MAG: hypothetical protein ETSY2_16540 [Candidatus Entotheonella gemina]|uniref:Uncharacterized protein n=1 Tax=Candidatus Entotheonella gemina TaxID=1429439 RepID=W4M840_9BACT|nr:MAG: hypothetical protein ETSY2_16540 [Candidatus Entotheonella gemina]